MAGSSGCESGGGRSGCSIYVVLCGSHHRMESTQPHPLCPVPDAARLKGCRLISELYFVKMLVRPAASSPPRKRQLSAAPALPGRPYARMNTDLRTTLLYTWPSRTPTPSGPLLAFCHAVPRPSRGSKGQACQRRATLVWARTSLLTISTITSSNTATLKLFSDHRLQLDRC